MWNQRCILFLRGGGAVDPKTTIGIDNVCIYIYTYIRIYIYICIPGSSWLWKFPHQSQNRSLLPNSGKKNSWTVISTPEHFFHTPERFPTVLNAFLTLSERFFPLRTSEVSWTAKITGVFFPHQPPKSTFFGFGVKNSCVGRLQASYFLEGLAHLTP